VKRPDSPRNRVVKKKAEEISLGRSGAGNARTGSGVDESDGPKCKRKTWEPDQEALRRTFPSKVTPSGFKVGLEKKQPNCKRGGRNRVEKAGNREGS